MKKLLTTIGIIGTFTLAFAGVSFARQLPLLQKNVFQYASAYWRMDEKSGTAFSDSTGNGRTGTINSATIGQIGVFNGAFYLNDLTTSNCPTVPSNSAWQFGTGNFTISFWIKAPSQTSYGTAVIGDTKSWVGGTGNPRFTIKYNWTGNSASYANKVQIDYYDSSGTNHILSSNALGYNTWNLITAVRNGDTMYLYQNGSLVTSSTGWSSYSLNIAVSGYALTLGVWAPDNGGTSGIQITLDDVFIDNGTALSSPQIADLFTSRSLEGNGISR